MHRSFVLTAAFALLFSFTQGCSALKRCAYAGPGRDDWQRPDEVVSALAIERGARVADLGAGGGYFTFRLADAVGPDGRVYAVDVDRAMLDYIEARSREESRSNVEVILAAPDDPKLPPDGVDLVFSSNTYHHLAERPAYFGRMKSALRPGGRVAIVEYEEHSGWLSWLIGSHATEGDAIRGEMEEAGYELTDDFQFLERQSFLVFEAKGSSLGE